MIKFFLNCSSISNYSFTMSSPSPPRPGPSPLLRRTLELNLAAKKKRASFNWGLLNGALFAIFSYDLWCMCSRYKTYWHMAEYALAALFGLNAFYHMLRYIYLTLVMSPVPVTPLQKKLLGFTDLDTSYKLKKPDSTLPSTPALDQSEPFNISSRSWRTGSSPDASQRSVTSTSWSFQRGSPPQQDTSASFNFSADDDFIADRRTLDGYLRQGYPRTTADASRLATSRWPYILGRYPRTTADTSHLATSTPPSILQPHCRSKAIINTSKLPRRSPCIPKFEAKEAMNPADCSEGTLWSPTPELTVRNRSQYQLAPLNTSSSAAEDGGAGVSGQSSPHVWWRLHLDPQRLTQWNLNLRLWISATILERLVKEITSIDDALHKHGLSDVKIGLVGLERLRKTASGTHAARHVPTLAALVPFLELDNNQEYLVQRIRELANGGVMSAYKWNGGGTFKDKSWDESLPTDSELVMHLFATYLDTQLLPVTQSPDSKPFSSQHYTRAPAAALRALTTLALHQATLRPPHFLLINGEEAIEVAKGRNNLIHTILLFLHRVVTKHHGMLGRVNLGKSGVNILWVIDR